MGRIKPKKLPDDAITATEAEQLLKAAAVLLRDKSPLSFQRAVTAFVWCWNVTESCAEHDARMKAP